MNMTLKQLRDHHFDGYIGGGPSAAFHKLAVDLLDSLPDGEQAVAYIDSETRELHSASHIDWLRKNGSDVSGVDPLVRMNQLTTPRPAVATARDGVTVKSIMEIVEGVIGDHGGEDLDDEDVRHSFDACLRERLEAALAQPRPMGGVPEGWKLVPVEPTQEMQAAARDWSAKKYGQPVGYDASAGCYKAMLAAAPESGGG